MLPGLYMNVQLADLYETELYIMFDGKTWFEGEPADVNDDAVSICIY